MGSFEEEPSYGAGDEVTTGLSAQEPVTKPARKIFCDPVHGHISLHPVSVAIIDTPQFQRLREIKQLALLQYIYPGATHTRFEHSLGTAYLAQLFISKLKEQQPELQITDKQVLCLEVAGLCHDLGHGPFSHLWETIYEAGAEARGVTTCWKHEKTSCDMLTHLLHENNLMDVFKKWEENFAMGLTKDDIKVVQQLILGEEGPNGATHFMFQIINNGDSGLDVDKWDYYLRDCHSVGLSSSFDFRRLVNSARVIRHKGVLNICFRDKEIHNVYEMFRTRSTLHRLVYQHRLEKLIEQMVCDAVHLVDEKITGIDGKPVTFWQTTYNVATLPTHENLRAYCKLTDSVVRCLIKLNASTHPDVVKARQLWTAFETRFQGPTGLYKLVGKIPCAATGLLTKAEVADKLIRITSIKPGGQPVRHDDVAVQLVSIHWGQESNDPVKNILFYSKNASDEAFHTEAIPLLGFCQHMIPKEFQDSWWNIVLRKSDPDCAAALKRSVEMLQEALAKQPVASGLH